MGKGDPPVQEVSYSETLDDMITAQQKHAPTQLDQYKEFQPQYAEADLNILYDTLLGNGWQSGDGNGNTWRAGSRDQQWIDEQGNAVTDEGDLANLRGRFDDGGGRKTGDAYEIGQGGQEYTLRRFGADNGKFDPGRTWYDSEGNEVTSGGAYDALEQWYAGGNSWDSQNKRNINKYADGATHTIGDPARNFTLENEYRPGAFIDVDGNVVTEGEDANRGLLDIYRNEILPEVDAMQIESQGRQRAGDIADIERLGGDAYDAMRSYNPNQTALADKMYDQAMTDLTAGRRLTPEEYREVEQSVRGGQGYRGMGYGDSDLFAEAMAVGQAGENRLRTRQAFGSQVLAQQQALYGDPWMQVVGRASGQAPLAMGFAGQGSGIAGAAGPKSFVQESQNAFDIAGYNANAHNAASISSANNKAAVTGSIFGAVGSAAGGLGGGFLAGRSNPCWVAREIYGVQNPRWLLFRSWLMTSAPGWFRRLYIAYGERFAQWIQGKDRIKNQIRKWMDRKIEDMKCQ